MKGDTAVILIGNSDNKLTQLEWAHFVVDMKRKIENFATRIHFFGSPPNYDPRQNACWVIEVDSEKVDKLKEGISKIRSNWKQDSAAFMFGTTTFI